MDNPFDSSPQRAPHEPSSASVDIDDLQETLYFQKAILASLLEQPNHPDKEVQVAKAEIATLQKRLLDARRSKTQDSTTANAANMNDYYGRASVGGPPGQYHHWDFPASSNMSTPSDSSSSWDASGNPNPSNRKRTFSTHLDGDERTVSENKSLRTTPSPMPSASALASTPATSNHHTSGFEWIDLSNLEDEEVATQQRDRFETYSKQKELRDRDEKLARQLQEGRGFTNGRASPAPLARSGPSAFDRITGRSSLGSQSSGLAGQSTEARQAGVKTEGQSRPELDMSYNSVSRLPQVKSEPTTEAEIQRRVKAEPSDGFGLPPRVKSEFHVSPSSRGLVDDRIEFGQPSRHYKMPGSFDSYDDDPDDELEFLGTRPVVPVPSLQSGYGSSLSNGHGYPRLPVPQLPARPAHHSNSYTFNTAPGISAAQLAQQVALSRQNPGQSYGFGGYAGNNVPTFGSLSQSSSLINAEPNNPFGLPPSPWAPTLPRPGMVSNGSYDPLNPYNSPVTSASQLGPMNQSGSLADAIARTQNPDYYNPRYTQWVSDMIDDPRKNEEEIKELLTNIRPDMDIPEEEREGTPDALRYPLYVHQRLALDWMKRMEEGTSKGAILADDMGLGKTISTLALMSARPSSDRRNKTNLIVGPVALIKQWELEIKKKLKPEHGMSVFLLHGKKAVYSDLSRYDVVLTTYGTIAQEWKRYQKHHVEHENSTVESDKILEKKCPILHPKSKWYRVILDEAQCIKNKDTQSSKGAEQIQATYRWCLTGTPMMNGVSELFPLVRFLRVKPYKELKKFNEAFGSLTPKSSSKISGYQRNNAMKKLQVLLKAIMLRRMKNSKIDGEPILDLPPKTEEVVHVVFSEEEQSFYNDLEGKSQVQFNKYLRAGTVGKNYSNILVLLLRLRQACCHPHLNLDFETVGGELSTNDMVELAKTLDENAVKRIKEAEAFSCPICLDATLNPTIVLPCGHDTCLECFQRLTEDAAHNNLRDGRENEGGTKCVVCRGAIDLKRVIDYNAFVKVHMPEKAIEMGLEGIAGSAPDDDSVTDSSDEESAVDDLDSNSDDVDDQGNLRDFIVPDDASDDVDFPALGEGEGNKTERKPKSKVKTAGRPKKSKSKGKKIQEEVQPHMLMRLRQESGKNKEARSRYMHYLKNNWEPSAKVTKACELLGQLQETGEKTIIFSVWTGLLDLLEIPIKYSLKMKYCRYDGGMSRTQRDHAARSFMEDSRVKVMLVSLKAGNAGLNLTAASHVIIMDPFWNPYIEMQAVDRAHRIGQQRPVKVHRILVQETVEDRIVQLQERKRQLVDAALDEGEMKNLGRLNTQELRHLFGVRS